MNTAAERRGHGVEVFMTDFLPITEQTQKLKIWACDKSRD